MSEYLPFVVFGITTGALYGVSAMGLVLTYRTSGLFNFGHGAISAVAAFTFHTLHNEHGVPWPVAAIVAVPIFGLGAGLLLERFAAALSDVAITFKIVGTIGLLVGVRALVALIWGQESRVFPPFLPQRVVLRIADVGVTLETVIIVSLGLAAAVSLLLTLRYTRLGIAMRAVVDDPALLDMTGIDPSRVRRVAWIIGMSFAAASGVLFASVQQQVQVDVLALLVVQAFGAAALARFTSLPMSFAAGIGIGIAQKLISKQTTQTRWLLGLDLNVPFLVLFIVLLVARRGWLVDVGRQVKARAIPASPFSAGWRRSGYGLAAVALVALPHLVGTRLPLWNAAMSQVALFLSLSLLVRLSGQISLCQFGFAAIGAAAFGHLSSTGLPWGLAVVGAGLITVPVGALIAIPAIRLSGLYLGLATLGFGLMLQQFLYSKHLMFGIGQQLRTPRPGGLDSNLRYYYVLLGVAVVAALVVTAVERGRLGRLLKGLADAPLALSTLGTNTRVTLVLVFCLSAGLAGVSGALYGGLFDQVGGFSFPAVQSLTTLAVLVAAGRRLVAPAFVAPVLLFVVPGYLDSDHITLGMQLGFGVVAVAVAASSQGAVGAWLAAASERARDRLVGPTDRALNRAAPAGAGR